MDISRKKSMSNPPSFENIDQSKHILQLVKALYGIKQASRACYGRLFKFFLTNGFKRVKIDNTLFLKPKGKNLSFIQVYIDDIIFGATTDTMCENFTKLMRSEFEISMIGELNKTPTGTMIFKEKYIKKLLNRFHMSKAKPVDNSIRTNCKLDTDEPGPKVNEIMYRGIIEPSCI